MPSSEHLPKDKPDEELRSCVMQCKAMVLQLVTWERISSGPHFPSSRIRHRYAKNLRCMAIKKSRLTGLLSQEKLTKTEITIYHSMQRECYITRASSCRNSSGWIRPENQIPAATFIAYDARLPIILPKEDFGTKLFQKFLHVTGKRVVNEIRQRLHFSRLKTQGSKRMCTVQDKEAESSYISNGAAPFS